MNPTLQLAIGVCGLLILLLYLKAIIEMIIAGRAPYPGRDGGAVKWVIREQKPITFWTNIAIFILTWLMFPGRALHVAYEGWKQLRHSV